MKKVTIEFKSNLDDVLASLNSKSFVALETCGLLAESYAQEKLTSSHAVDTGNLRNSIQHKVGIDDMYVGTNVEYGIYVEMGTGIYTSGGRQTPWSWQDEDGKWHRTRGMKKRPFIKPAIAEHVDQYKQIIKETLDSE